MSFGSKYELQILDPKQSTIGIQVSEADFPIDETINLLDLSHNVYISDEDESFLILQSCHNNLNSHADYPSPDIPSDSPDTSPEPLNDTEDIFSETEVFFKELKKD